MLKKLFSTERVKILPEPTVAGYPAAYPGETGSG